MPAPDFLQDQLAQLKGQLRQVNDLIDARQQELAKAQAKKTEIQASMQDVKDAYQAWKGTQP